jgi:hypothetical protein
MAQCGVCWMSYVMISNSVRKTNRTGGSVATQVGLNRCIIRELFPISMGVAIDFRACEGLRTRPSQPIWLQKELCEVYSQNITDFIYKIHVATWWCRENFLTSHFPGMDVIRNTPPPLLQPHYIFMRIDFPCCFFLVRFPAKLQTLRAQSS